MTAAHHIAVVASAGTGKTYSLVENYLRALFGMDGTGERKRPCEILALTFTQKAANEMRLRITKELSQLLLKHSHDGMIGRMFLTEKLAPLAKNDVQRIIRAIPNAPIATFHSFALGFLKREAKLRDCGDDFDILSPREEGVLARNVLRSLILAEISSDNTVIKSLVARLRLTSGVISLGLIDGLLSIYFKLSESGIDVRDLVALTAGEEPEKFQIDACLNSVQMALNKFLLAEPSKNTQKRLTTVSDKLAVFNDSLAEKSEFHVARSFLELRNAVKGNFGNRAHRGELVAAIVGLGAKLVDSYVFEDEMAVAHLLVKFHDDFERLKRAAKKLSYGDLLRKTKEALAQDHSLRRRMKSRIKHVLVDEYQDTSPLQEDILALLLENRNKESDVSGNGRVLDQVELSFGSSLFVVGDTKQSIYGFRGADASLMSQLMDRLALSGNGEGLSRRSLNTNRRSSQRVIELINLVSKHTGIVDSGHDANLYGVFESVGKCALWVDKGNKSGERFLSNLSCTAFGITRLLQERPDVRPKDIAVLVRRIKAAGIVKDKLADLLVPARIVGGDGFFQQQEIVDILSFLKLITDPTHSLALAVVLRSPLVLLKDEEIFALKLVSSGPISLLSADLAVKKGLLDEDIKAKMVGFFDALENVRLALSKDGLASALDRLLDHTDFFYALGLSANHDQRLANLKKLSSMFLRDVRNPLVAIDDYYQRIVEDSKEPMAVSAMAIDAVTIMTIHQSKGLEFDIAVVADGESIPLDDYGEFLVDKHRGIAMKPKGRPIAACLSRGTVEKEIKETRYDEIKAKQKSRDLGELARLLYVAITRAKKELYVACSHESYFIKAHKDSLMGLFLRAFHDDKEEFLRICPVEEISELDRQVAKECEQPPIDDIQSYKKSGKKIRIFASNLIVSESSQIPQLINPDVGDISSPVDGNLLHNLVASAGRMLLLGDEPLLQLVNVGSRSLGLKRDQRCKVLEERALITLQLLKAEFLHAQQAIFEMPLCSWTMPDVMIEGFADLVIIHDSHVSVIEFKSSKRLAVHPDTYFQALAYAHALSLQWQKPIKFAVVLMGASAPIRFVNYDDFSKTVFLHSVREHLLLAKQ